MSIGLRWLSLQRPLSGGAALRVLPASALLRNYCKRWVSSLTCMPVQ